MLLSPSTSHLTIEEFITSILLSYNFTFSMLYIPASKSLDYLSK